MEAVVNFLNSQLKNVADEQLDLYMEWLLKAIERCESEADRSYADDVNKTFKRLKQRMMRQELKRHSQELRHILNEKKRRLSFWCR